MTWDDVLACAADLPGLETSTSYGTPALKLRGKLVTRLRREDDSLVLFGIPPDEREALIAAAPVIFHVTPHYEGHAIVLARLSTLEPARLRTFLLRRWRELMPKRDLARLAASSGLPAPE